MKNNAFYIKFSILKMKIGHFIFVLFFKVVQEVFYTFLHFKIQECLGILTKNG